MFDAERVIDLSRTKYARLHPIVRPSTDKPKLLKKLIESVFRLAGDGLKGVKGVKPCVNSACKESYGVR